MPFKNNEPLVRVSFATGNPTNVIFPFPLC